MKMIKFMYHYLNMDAKISIIDQRGNFLFTGKCGDAPNIAFSGRNVIKVEGIGSEDDLMIYVTDRNIKAA